MYNHIDSNDEEVSCNENVWKVEIGGPISDDLLMSTERTRATAF